MSESEDQPLALRGWNAELPPSDFTERVMARLETLDVAPKRRRTWAVASGVTAFAIAAALFLWLNAPPSRGEKLAHDRVEVAIGSRALAVLEPDARVGWNGDDVEQTRGDVFYRVDPGRRFTVHTAAGNVAVKGTCFTVKVRGEGSSTLAMVIVHEGKVAVSRSEGALDLQAGESARLGPGGIERLGHGEGERSFEEAAAAAVKGDILLGKANENLVRQVSEYRARLESVASQKSELEAKLKASEERLAAAQDGASPVWSSDFDPSPEAWKELAKDGTIKYDVPCFKREAWAPKPETLRALGLEPGEGASLGSAIARSHDRLWSIVKPLCANAVGSDALAERFGVSTCMYLVLDIENGRDPQGAAMAQKQVSEIRAGLHPMPRDIEALHPIAKLFLATTGEGQLFEQDLAQSFGPEEARRLRFADEMCRTQHIFSGSKR